MTDTQIAFHEAAQLYPLMDDTRFAELVEDMRVHEQRYPIVLHDGKISDGRNRYLACLKLGIEPKFVDGEGDPFAYAWSANGQRRDLGLDQRYLIWREVTAKSAAWQAKQAEIAAVANAKRSAAQKGIPKAEKERADTSSVQTLHHPGAKAKAAASHTNRGTVERMDRLATKRPDLAKEVRDGVKKPTEALREMLKAEVAAKAAPLPAGQYRVLYADPPWQYSDARTGLGAGDSASGGKDRASTAARNNYPTMSVAELSALDVKALAAPDSVLLCWATFPLLPDALEVVKAWGFKYKTAFVWEKDGGAFGHYHKANAELLLVCTRGSCTPGIEQREDQVQRFNRTKHSAKPEEWRALIDRLWPHGPRLELFRRGAAPRGWSCWGAEVEEAA